MVAWEERSSYLGLENRLRIKDTEMTGGFLNKRGIALLV
jgi:hypothetical protein